MREPENIRSVMETDADWMGFIFYERSPRYIPAASLPDISIRPLRKVGVFVNATREQILETATLCQLDYIQLHGDESPAFCHALQKRGLALIKAFAIAGEKDLEKTKAYEGYVDYFLFDTKSGQYGGSGQQFDWTVLSAYTGQTPFLLSGGIRPESIEALQRFTHPRLCGIDLNSGFETIPGLKDIPQLKTFINNLKNKQI